MFARDMLELCKLFLKDSEFLFSFSLGVKCLSVTFNSFMEMGYTDALTRSFLCPLRFKSSHKDSENRVFPSDWKAGWMMTALQD